MRVLIGIAQYRDGKLSVVDRWDIRNVLERVVCTWNDAHNIGKLSEAMAFLIVTPVISQN